MSNLPPEHCPYCGTELDDVDPPTVFHCPDCEDYRFYNPTPGGSVAVVDGDALLLVCDFRYDDRWKLPSGRVETGESIREGSARELEEETGLSVDPEDLAFVTDNAGEPVPGQHMTTVTFAADRSATTGVLEAGDDATDARFFTPDAFAADSATFTDVHVDRFGTDSFEWLLGEVRGALDRSR